MRLKTDSAACRLILADICLINVSISFLIKGSEKNCRRPKEGNRNASREHCVSRSLTKAKVTCEV